MTDFDVPDDAPRKVKSVPAIVNVPVAETLSSQFF
jgi:hypothetical protein